ncbi:MAG: hypothetical protein JJE21_11130, partial [Spirochaetaceae bacterium]|nr:hypothetical protein [Spirochaetaceae bacterium]
VLFSELLTKKNDYITDSSLHIAKRLFNDSIITLDEYLSILKNLQYPQHLIDEILSENQDDDDDDVFINSRKEKY